MLIPNANPDLGQPNIHNIYIYMIITKYYSSGKRIFRNPVGRSVADTRYSHIVNFGNFSWSLGQKFYLTMFLSLSACLRMLISDINIFPNSLRCLVL